MRVGGAQGLAEVPLARTPPSGVDPRVAGAAALTAPSGSPRDPELHFQAILMGGRVHDEVLCDPHLIVPGQVYGLFCHFCHDEVFGRGHWQEKGRTAWTVKCYEP